MSKEPKIKPLPSRKRQLLFWFLVLVFVAVLMVLISYASGNRLTLDDYKTNITGVGGIYLTGDMEKATITLDEKKIANRRLFDDRLYIKNISPGRYLVEVKRPGLQTWRKFVTVYPYIVTKATVFNLPLKTPIRLITENNSVSSDEKNTEHNRLVNLLSDVATDTAPGKVDGSSAAIKLLTNIARLPIDNVWVATQSVAVSDSVSGITKPAGDNNRLGETKTIRSARLFKQAGLVYVAWDGKLDEAPFYHCFSNNPNQSNYSIKVGELLDDFASGSLVLKAKGDRFCKLEILVSKMGQEVFFFAFFPGRSDLVLLQYKDGLYVTEVDGLGGRNSQLLYPGENLRVLINAGRIYIKDKDLLVEVMTTI